MSEQDPTPRPQSELERAVAKVDGDTLRAYQEHCRDTGEQDSMAGLLEFAGLPNPLAGVESAYIDYLERKYPGTRWSRSRDAGDEGVVRRRLVSPEDLENLDERLGAALRAAHGHDGNRPS
jgi:hypothetical protein